MHTPYLESDIYMYSCRNSFLFIKDIFTQDILSFYYNNHLSCVDLTFTFFFLILN